MGDEDLHDDSARPRHDQLLSDLETVVDETLTALRSEFPVDARVDHWDSRAVATHFLYWHDATALGISSATTGGLPWPVPGGHERASSSRISARPSSSRSRSVAALIESDLDHPAFSRPDGTTVSIRARLEGIARHWRTHLEALRESTATGAHEP